MIGLGFVFTHLEQMHALWVMVAPIRKHGLMTSILVLIGMGVCVWLLARYEWIQREVKKRRARVELAKRQRETYLELRDEVWRLTPRDGPQPVTQKLLELMTAHGRTVGILPPGEEREAEEAKRIRGPNDR